MIRMELVVVVQKTNILSSCIFHTQISGMRSAHIFLEPDIIERYVAENLFQVFDIKVAAAVINKNYLDRPVCLGGNALYRPLQQFWPVLCPDDYGNQRTFALHGKGLIHLTGDLFMKPFLSMFMTYLQNSFSSKTPTGKLL